MAAPSFGFLVAGSLRALLEMQLFAHLKHGPVRFSVPSAIRFVMDGERMVVKRLRPGLEAKSNGVVAVGDRLVEVANDRAKRKYELTGEGIDKAVKEKINFVYFTFERNPRLAFVRHGIL